MALDSLTSRERHLALFERYGALLTDHQREVLRLHLAEDWSLSEVARHQETSRAAVHDAVRRSAQILEDHERRLGLLVEDRERASELEAIARELADLRRRAERAEDRIRALGGHAPGAPDGDDRAAAKPRRPARPTTGLTVL